MKFWHITPEDQVKTRWEPSYHFYKKKTFKHFIISCDMRDRKSVWGRFGGGWNWKVGFQLGGSTLVVSILLIEARISIRKKEPK